MHNKKIAGSYLQPIVLVAALGYFVDIYDLLLFSINRISSLTDIGLSGSQLTGAGLTLLNFQMTGLLIGGIFWGVLGDKKGRLSVLYSSIVLYSVANICNGFAYNLETYAIWRFVAGFGLAGELGLGITMVAELLPREKRGIGTTIVAAVGVSGAVVAYFIAQYFSWRISYFIGGGLGLTLLLFRIGVMESGIFLRTQKNQAIKRGNFLMLFTDKVRFVKYLRCIIIGVPLWFVVGILITLSPEFSLELGVKGKVNAGAAVAFCYGGLVIGDIASGLLSQLLKSRIKVVFAYLCLSTVTLCLFFLLRNESLLVFYLICGMLGLSVGYWVLFMTIATEQFGTNIRATVTTTAPNFVRGMVVPVSLLFTLARQHFLDGSFVKSGILVGGTCLLLAFFALNRMPETFSKDLDYQE